MLKQFQIQVHSLVGIHTMKTTISPTKIAITEAANKLFYAKGIRAVSVDAIAEKAGLTKKTLYYHFKSKDLLIEAYLQARAQPNLDAFKSWFEDANGSLPQRIEAIFSNLEVHASHPKWRGCGFLRTAGELAHLPGHPAIKAASNHKKNVEAWLTDILHDGGCDNPPLLARQVQMLIDGAFSIVLVHHDTTYVRDAGKAAAMLVSTNLPSLNH